MSIVRSLLLFPQINNDSLNSLFLKYHCRNYVKIEYNNKYLNIVVDLLHTILENKQEKFVENVCVLKHYIRLEVTVIHSLYCICNLVLLQFKIITRKNVFIVYYNIIIDHNFGSEYGIIFIFREQFTRTFNEVLRDFVLLLSRSIHLSLAKTHFSIP